MKNNIKISALLTSLALTTHLASAGDIEVTIEGTGTIKALEAEQECNESCTITNDLSTNTLQAISEDFTGWTGQKCDAGNELIFDGSFGSLSTAPGGAKTLVKADINQNSLVDLAYISLFDGQIGLLVNQGNSNFEKVQLDNGLSYPTALAFYDWDQDGDADLLVAEFNASKLKLYSNDGAGAFTFTKNIQIPGFNPYAISVADINQDNLPDLAISSFSADTSGNLQTLVGTIQNPKTVWLTNNGQDDFTVAAELSNIAALTTDVFIDNENATVELVAAEVKSGEVVIYSTDMNSLATSRQVIAQGSAAYGVAFGDADDNGTLDVLSAHYRPSMLQLTYRNSEGEFNSFEQFNNFSEGVTATVITDINGDGYKDMVTGEFNNNRFLYATTISYLDCIITSDSKAQITANFGNADTSPVGGTPVTTPTAGTSDKESSGGGSFHFFYWLLACLALGLKYKSKA